MIEENFNLEIQVMKTIFLPTLFFVIVLFSPSQIYSQQPVKVIFDTDMAGDCDDVGALAVLHALSDLGEAEILAVVTNRKDPSNASAAAADVINTYYGRSDIPIGTDKDGAKFKHSNPSPYTLTLKKEFPNNSFFDHQMPDALSIYRKTLVSQPDSSVVICSVGALSNLEDLIRSQSDEFSDLNGLELVRRKVKRTIIMGGGFPRTSVRETNILLDPAAAVTVVNEWPGEIIWQGFEVGAAVYTGSELKQVDLKNPIKRAFELRPFRGQNAIDQGKPSHDQAAVLIAVRGIDSFFWRISPPGYVVIDSEGNTEWKSKKAGKHRYVSIKCHPAYLEKIISDLMVATPKL